MSWPETRSADGTVTIELQGRFRDYTVVRMGSDGKLIHQCVDDAGTLHRVRTEHGPAPLAPEEE